MTTVPTTMMMKMKRPCNKYGSLKMRCRFASLLFSLLMACSLMPPSCHAQEQVTDVVDEEDTAAKKDKPPGNKGGLGPRKHNGDLQLAESYDSVTMVRTNPSGTPQAGDYFVWSNQVWSFDEKEHAPTAVIGTSRGQCVLLQDDDTAAGHCSFTLTFTKIVNQRGKDDNDEEEEEETPEVSKLMIMGDVDSLEWDFKQTLAIVGGTGKHEAAAGIVDVVAKSGFLLYEIYLD